eukprot:gene27293-32965_t
MATTQTRSMLLAGAASVSLALAAYVSYTYTTKGSSSVTLTSSEQREDCPEEIKQELLARVCSFFGEDGLKKLRSSFVIVVGLGGVGSHCAHMLARSGVGRLRLIDFDQVTLSSLNRHAVATLADVGISKAEAMRRRLKDIVPW